MDKFEQQITDYVFSLSYGDLNARTIQAAKERVLDGFACAMAAYDKIPSRAMRNLALRSSAENGATVIGTKHISTVYDAAITLGTMMRALDWNDTYLSREPAHPSDNIAVPMSLSESMQKNGKELILAIIIGYELQCRLCDAAAIRKKGWDHVTYGSVSVAASASKLLGLSKAEIRHAIAIAVTTGNFLRQTRIGTISNWKAAAFAKAAKNALEAALYVKNGFSGPMDIINGQHGLINQITRGEFDLSLEFGGQGDEQFKIVNTYIKYFPAEYHSQSAIWAALDLRKQVGAENLQKINSILVETSFHSYEIIGMEPDKWQPKTKETADHSLPYIVAAALMDGDITLQQFDREHLENKELSALVQKVKCREKKEYTDIYGTSFPNKITITMNDGKVYEKEVKDPKGHPLNPLSKQEIETKFINGAGDFIKNSQKEKIIEMVWNLENLDNIKDLIDCFEVGN